ncbi:MAG: hypothetical protein EPN93_11050 [Spirochaetes bacterium]|nr:MAG: hypothetical protein EPN93_11050 [Spirochaetota bacterium]
MGAGACFKGAGRAGLEAATGFAFPAVFGFIFAVIFGFALTAGLGFAFATGLEAFFGDAAFFVFGFFMKNIPPCLYRISYTTCPMVLQVNIFGKRRCSTFIEGNGMPCESVTIGSWITDDWMMTG